MLLQVEHFGFVRSPIQLVLIGISPRTHRLLADRLGQFRIFDIEVAVGIAHLSLPCRIERAMKPASVQVARAAVVFLRYRWSIAVFPNLVAL